MNFRVVYIVNPCSLNFKNNSLVVKNEQGETNVPLNDISTILIDNLQVNISAFLLSKISESKIVLIVVDERHLPCGVLLPYSGKVRMLEAYSYQMNLKDEFVGNLWKKIVKKTSFFFRNTIFLLIFIKKLISGKNFSWNF